MTDSKSTPAKPRRWLGDILIALLVLASIGGVVWFIVRPADLPDGIARGDYDRAERRFQRAYGRTPTTEEVFYLLGELKAEADDYDKALACLRQIPTDDPKCGLKARLLEGEVYIKSNQAARAEESLKECLRLISDNEDPPDGISAGAYTWLSYLLSVELRFEERKRYLEDLHEAGQARVFDSKQLYFPHLLIWRSPTGRERLRGFLQEDPTNLDLRIAQGRYLTADGRLDESRPLLEDIHNKHASHRYAAAALLECLYEQGDETKYRDVAQSLPPFEPGEPWLLTLMRGQFAIQDDRFQDGAGHFQQVLKWDPANPEAQMGLARAYDQQGDASSREKALGKSRALAEIRVFLSNVTEDDAEASLKLAFMCESLGLDEAAKTFRGHAERISSRQQIQEQTFLAR